VLISGCQFDGVLREVLLLFLISLPLSFEGEGNKGGEIDINLKLTSV
jgi:hypothetical protein